MRKNLQVSELFVPLQSLTKRKCDQRTQILVRGQYWRDGRVVECGGLENR